MIEAMLAGANQMSEYYVALVSEDTQPRAKVFDGYSGDLVYESSFAAGFTSVDLSPGLGHIALARAGTSDDVRIENFETGVFVTTLVDVFNTATACLKYSPDGAFLAAYKHGSVPEIKVFETSGYTQVASYSYTMDDYWPRNNLIDTINWSNDSRYLLMNGKFLFDSNLSFSRTDTGLNDGLGAFCADNKFINYLDDRSTVYVYEIGAGTLYTLNFGDRPQGLVTNISNSNNCMLFNLLTTGNATFDHFEGEFLSHSTFNLTPSSIDGQTFYNPNLFSKSIDGRSILALRASTANTSFQPAVLYFLDEKGRVVFSRKFPSDSVDNYSYGVVRKKQ